MNKKQMHLSGIFAPSLIQDSCFSLVSACSHGLAFSEANIITTGFFFIIIITTGIDAVFIANPEFNKHLQADSTLSKLPRET